MKRSCETCKYRTSKKTCKNPKSFYSFRVVSNSKKCGYYEPKFSKGE